MTPKPKGLSSRPEMTEILNDSTLTQAICGKDEVPLEPIADSQPESWRCPVCGDGDTRENVMREVKEHMKEVVARGFQNAIRKGIAGNPNIKAVGDLIPKRSYRFISDLETRD